MTVEINTHLLILSVAVAAAACKGLHEKHRSALDNPPPSRLGLHLSVFYRLPQAIILFTKYPYPSAGSETILKKYSNVDVGCSL